MHLVVNITLLSYLFVGCLIISEEHKSNYMYLYDPSDQEAIKKSLLHWNIAAVDDE